MYGHKICIYIYIYIYIYYIVSLVSATKTDIEEK